MFIEEKQAYRLALNAIEPWPPVHEAINGKKTCWEKYHVEEYRY
jgi:hypothetical protein